MRRFFLLQRDLRNTEEGYSYYFRQIVVLLRM